MPDLELPDQANDLTFTRRRKDMLKSQKVRNLAYEEVDNSLPVVSAPGSVVTFAEIPISPKEVCEAGQDSGVFFSIQNKRNLFLFKSIQYCKQLVVFMIQNT